MERPEQEMMAEKTKLLIIDDDPKVAWILREGLEEDYEIISASDGSEGIQIASQEKPPLILLDIKMPGIDGLEVLRKLKKSDHPSDVIMLSGQGETQVIVEAMKAGAAEFITKPFDVREVGLHLAGVLDKRRLKDENLRLKVELETKEGYKQFVGDSSKMQQIKNLIPEVADSELSVLIRGESGTGKEIVSRMMHSLSRRRSHPFIKVNCAAIPRELLEAELFGYEKGAFTGAHKTKPGRFEIANKGTIFLDEIGDMSFELQSKLLQVLEQQEFVRVGGISNIKVDVRFICATNKDLERAIMERQFRDDLFYRLNEITVFIPPLRERREDIPLLVDHFLNKYTNLYNRSFDRPSSACLDALVGFYWPGNVRQLENMIKQMVVRQDESIVFEVIRNSPQAVPAGGQSPNWQASDYVSSPGGASGMTSSPVLNSYSLKERISKTVEEEEKKLIAEVLRRTNWNRRKASEILGISYRSLLYKIKEYRINEIK